MNDQYFILEDGEQTGPFSLDEVIEKEPDLHTRILSPTEDTWQDACDLPELYQYFIDLGVNFPTENNLASFWIRLGAFIIDMILIVFTLDLIVVILSSMGYLPNLMTYTNVQALMKLPVRQFVLLEITGNALIILYYTFCEASAMKGTVGKWICRLQVVDADGMGLTFLNALVRSVGKIVSTQFYGIGFISIFWTEHRQALHDFIAKSYVVKKS
jgi:uncharacterized RDD family membrane protein YckC